MSDVASAPAMRRLQLDPVTILAGASQRRLIGWVTVGCVLLACALCWFDVLRPGRIVPEGLEGSTDRGAGLFMNPNGAGAFIVMGTIAAVPMIPSRLRGLLLTHMERTGDPQLENFRAVLGQSAKP